MAYIKIKGLKKTYQVTKTEKQEVLKGLDVEFDNGEFVALLGESGCGKSTFLNILAGLDFDYSGSIEIQKQFLRDFTERDLDNYRKHQVGIVFQNFNLVKQMTAFENVMLPLSLSELTMEERKARVTELFEKVGLTGHENKLPNQLSGGQKQRVAIARALAMNPSMILADEPTGNLDKDAAEEVMTILKDIAVSGKLVICVTHSAKVASNCTRVLTMDNGIIVKNEATKSYKTDKSTDDKPLQHKENIDKKEIFSIAKNNIKQSFKRSLMVTIALSIGICAFVLMFFISTGLRNYVENEVDMSMNKYQINVQMDKNNVSVLDTDAFTPGQQTYLGLITGVKEVHKATILTDFNSEYRTTTGSLGVTGGTRLYKVTSTYEGFKANMFAGGYPSHEAGKREILISSAMATRLIGTAQNGINSDNIIGSTIDMRYGSGGWISYEIVGVTDDSDIYDQVYMSYDSIRALIASHFPSGLVNLVYVIAEDVSSINAIVEDITASGFLAYRQDTLAEDLMGYIDLGSFVLATISAISLVVSAIMIFIVMYISVVERTKEIGILRALGARRRDIRRIFMVEAGAIGLAAGIIGVLFSIIIGLIANAATGFAFVGIHAGYIFLGLGISFVVSILSSLGPAAEGARLDPVESLRSE